jgi:hypothetical protein
VGISGARLPLGLVPGEKEVQICPIDGDKMKKQSQMRILGNWGTGIKMVTGKQG